MWFLINGILSKSVADGLLSGSLDNILKFQQLKFFYHVYRYMYSTNKTTVASSIDAFMYFLVKTLTKMPCKLYRYCSSCDSSKVCLWLTKQEILSKITADI